MCRLSQFVSEYHRGRGLRSENLVFLSTTASTNSAARCFAGSYLEQDVAPPASVVIARGQDAGRGRGSKTWESRYGKGVFLSIMHPLQSAERMEDLPVATAVGVCRAIRQWVGSECAIKWPNDLVVDGRKIAGILIEGVSQGSRMTSVIGIGVNYSQAENELPRNATSLNLLEAKPVALAPLGEIAGSIVRLVVEEISLMTRSRSATIASYREWTAHSVGELLSCSTVGGVRAGGFLGFDEQGFLRLDTADGETVVSSGEIVENSDRDTEG